MKNILKTIAFLMIISLMNGCQKITTEGYTDITYYPSITILGDNPTIIMLGDTFTDLGVTVMEGETDITNKVITKGTVNSNKVGFYYVTYSAANIDGISKTASRTVIVYDPSITKDISGNYEVVIDESYRLQFNNNAVIEYADLGDLYGGSFIGFTVDLDLYLPGIFKVNDLFGGYYFAGRKYDIRYQMGGYIALNSDNSIELLESRSPGFGDGLDDLVEAEYDPDTDII